MNLSAAGLRPGCRALLLAALLAVLPLAGPSAQPAQPGATAQDGQGAADAKTGELEALLETLESPEDREAFVARLRSLVEASRETAPRETPRPAPESLGARVLDTLSGRLDAIGRQVAQSLDHLLALPRVAAELWDEAQSGAARQRWLEIVAKLVLVLGVGFVAERLLIRLLARPRRSVEDRAGDSLGSRVLLLVARTLLDILPILGFALAAYVVLPLTQPREATRLVVLALVNANVIARAVGAAARLLLTPRVAQLRLVPLGDETANYAYIWVRRLTAVTVYGYYFAEAVLLLGLARDVYLFLLKAVGLLVTGMVLVLILQNRTVVAGALRGRPNATGRGLRARLAELWHVLAILYVFGLYGVWALEIHGGFVFLLRATVLTLLIAFIARLATAGARRLIERGFRLGDEVKERFPGLEARANRYLPVLHRVLRVAIYVLAALGVLQVWGLGGLGWLASDTGREIGGRILTILVVVGAALLLWELVSAVIENYLRRRQEAAVDPATSGRLLTLLPLLLNATRVILGVVVVMIVFSELGVDIAPLLAGAGVVGLAIGFGAQTLVK
ncbi:MAG TPA: mechanosensitive ion channel protein, partial [Kiloniellales bacterium]|nr:mechanosensitive ion channel protein [Kiloniellales bacterium]